MKTAKTEKTHLFYLDTIRALAALYVVIHHSVLQYYNDRFYPFKSIADYHYSLPKTYFLNFFMYGNYAVDLFIVVSGFSLMLSVSKNNFQIRGGSRTFFTRRLIRILPPYYLAMIFSLLLIFFFIGDKTSKGWDISIPVSFKDILLHFLLIHDFWESTIHRINHAFWSISVEFRIYFFFPLLIMIWRKINMLSLVIFSVFSSLIFSLLFYLIYQFNHDVNLGTGVSPYLILFTFGMIAADLSFSPGDVAKKFRAYYSKISPYLIVFILLGIVFTGKALRNIFRNTEISFLKQIQFEVKVFDVTLGIFYALILFVLAILSSHDKKNKLVQLFSWTPLVVIGSFSFSLYLIHAPLIAMISKYIITPLVLNEFNGTLLLIFLGTPLILLVSYTFFYFCERPFMNVGKKSISAKI